MRLKKIILEKLDFHKRQSLCDEMINKATNKIIDGYRGLEMALQYCENPDIKKKLEEIILLIGKAPEVSSAWGDENDTILSKLKTLMEDDSLLN